MKDRRLFVFFLSLLLILTFSNSAFGQGIYTYISGGYTGENFSFLAGFIGVNLGIGGGYVLNADYSKEQINDYPCPHDDYHLLGEAKVGNKVGLTATYPIRTQGRFIFLPGFGLYAQTIANVARSNVTGWYYAQSSRTQMGIELCFDAIYKAHSNFLLGLGFSLQRGVTGTLSFSF